MGKIVAIHSLSTGNGKSIITANLASQIALNGKRVGVVDTNFQSPEVYTYFGLSEDKLGKTMNDFLHGKATVREVGFFIGENASDGEGLSKLTGKKLWLFPASIHGVSQILRDGVDFNRLNEGLQTIITEFNLDYLFIDTHPGLNEETLLTIATSDILALILCPDKQDMQRTSAILEIARNLEVPDILLIVNKVPPKYDVTKLKNDIETQFDVPVKGVLSLSSDLVEGAIGDLFSLRFPDHEWSKKLCEAANSILKMK